MTAAAAAQQPTAGPVRPEDVFGASQQDAAALRRSDQSGPGIRRRRRGKGFSYLGPDGRPVTDQADLARIRSLVIPPAWEHVWICPDPLGHIQAGSAGPDAGACRTVQPRRGGLADAPFRA